MKLYYHPLSAYSRKVLIAMHEKQIDFTPEVVNLFDPEIKAAFKRDINPFGKLPVLKLEQDDWMIPESSIIIEYLDTHFDSGTDLIPADPDLARQVRFSDRISDLYLLSPAVSVLMTTMFGSEEARKSSEFEAQNAKVRETLGLFNQHIGSKQYLVNEQFSMADISASVAGVLLRDMLNVSLADWPNVDAWLNRCVSRDSWKKVNEEAGPYLAALAKPQA